MMYVGAQVASLGCVYILPFYKGLLDSAWEDMTPSFDKDSLELHPNGTFFIQFKKASLNMEIISHQFL